LVEAAIPLDGNHFHNALSVPWRPAPRAHFAFNWSQQQAKSAAQSRCELLASQASLGVADPR